MRTLAERAAGTAPPSSAEGTLFWDDFSSPAAARATAISFAIRDLAVYASPAVRLPVGTARPSAVIQNGLNQQVTVRWQLSADGSTWLDGDAGTVVAAATNATMSPNSVQAPYTRLTATAAIAPTSGSLSVFWYVPAPRWQAGGLGEAIVSCQADPSVLSGLWALSLKTRVRGAAINDTCSANRWIPFQSPSGILELGALVAVDGVDSTSKQVDLLWNDVSAAYRIVSAGLRYETPQSTGILSVLNSAGAWVSLGKPRLLYNGSGWADLRVAIDPDAGRYAYVAFNGEVMAVGGPAYTTVLSDRYGSLAQLMLIARTLAAASTEVLVDRVWVREIG